MALVEEYYELNEAEEPSTTWKVMQIIFYLFAACFGLWCGYTIGLLRLKFEDKCYLFTSLKNPPSKYERLNPSKVNWQNDSWCDYCQYSMVSSFIVATIWATFFLMCGKGGKSLIGLPQPWRIVWPSLIFNFIYFVISLCTAIYIQQGTDLFCYQSNLRISIQETSLVDNCPILQLLLLKDPHITSLQLEIVTKTSWGCVTSWVILFLISFTRIIFVIDFNLYKVCVFKISDVVHNKKEEVLRITNYEEPKKLNFYVSNRQLNTETEEKVENKEGEKQEKGKISKRSFPIQPNTAFYVTTDIRLLNREKKRKKSLKLLDQVFEKNKLNPTGPPTNRLNRIDDSDMLQLPSYSQQRDILSVEEKAQELINQNEESTAILNTGSIRNRNEKLSYSKELIPDDADRCVKFKKCD